jgi:hypothetical protein
VGESLEDDDRQARTVERFITALEDESRASESSTAGAS